MSIGAIRSTLRANWGRTSPKTVRCSSRRRHETGCTRVLVLSFSGLVLVAGASCFLLEKDWFKRIPPRAKVPLYVSLGVSLCFSITFTCVDLLNAYYDRNSYDLRRRALVQTPQQVGVVLAGAVANGAAFGFMFGMMDVEDAPQRLRQEERLSAPIGVVLGACVGAFQMVIANKERKETLREVIASASKTTEKRMWKHAQMRPPSVAMLMSPYPTVVAVTRQW